MVFPLPVGPAAVGLRERGLCPAPRRHARPRRARRPGRDTASARPCSGTRSSDRLDMLGTRLSGGQQQRLTLARALSHRPEILCLDEFSIAIDPVTTMKIEDVLLELKEQMTIVLVTNLVQQARRLADRTAFFSDSRLDRGGRDGDDFHPAGQPAHRALRQRRVRLMATAAVTTPVRHGIQTRDLNLWYGQFQALQRHHAGHQAGADHRADRSLRLRQDHAAALLQPHQRTLRQRHHHRPQSPSWARTSTTRTSRSASCASAWAWSFSGPIRCRSRSARTCSSASACTSAAASTAAATRRRWSSRPCATCSSGTRSRTS